MGGKWCGPQQWSKSSVLGPQNQSKRRVCYTSGLLRSRGDSWCLPRRSAASHQANWTTANKLLPVLF